MLRYPGGNELRQTGDPAEQQRDLLAAFDKLRARHASAEYRADEEAEIMARKNFAATGSFIAEDRPRALDLLGFSSQLVFNTFHNGRLHDLEHARPRPGLRRRPGPQPGHARVLLGRPPPAALALRPAGRPGAGRRGHARTRSTRARRRCWSRRAARPGFSPSHTDLFGVWAQAEEAGIPVVFHVGGTGTLIDPNYFVNGKPVPPDFHGGEENFRSVDYMGIPVPPAQTLATLIFDGVLERFPRPAHRRHRAGRHLGAVVAAPDGVRLRGLPPPRGAAAGAVAPADRLRAPAGPLHALPDRGRRLDRRRRPGPTS